MLRLLSKAYLRILLTDINSRVFFDLDSIRVNSFTGNFGEGQITAAGTVPLNDAVSVDPLTINFNQIQEVELPKLYQGGIRGQLQILGKATEPNITGNLTLFDGTIFLADENEDEAQTAVSDNDIVNSEQ